MNTPLHIFVDQSSDISDRFDTFEASRKRKFGTIKVEIPKKTARQKGIIQIGTCKIDEETDYKCVKLKYSDDQMDDFNRAVYASCLMSFKPRLRDIGAHVYHIDYKKSTMYMAFLECQTLKQFFQVTSIFEFENRSIIQKVLNSINYLLNILFEERIFHGDLHELNVMLCSPLELSVNKIAKFIDIDTMQYFSDNDEYNINIVDKIASDSKLTEFPSLSDTKSDALEIGMGIVAVSYTHLTLPTTPYV